MRTLGLLVGITTLSGSLVVAAETPRAPELRQMGGAEGFVDTSPRESLCERAEDAAWSRVWASCGGRKSVVDPEEPGCTTTDYRPANASGRGAWLRVRVEIRYSCR